MIAHLRPIAILLVLTVSSTSSYVTPPSFHRHNAPYATHTSNTPASRFGAGTTLARARTTSESSSDGGADNDVAAVADEYEDDEPEAIVLPNMEKAWRHAKKPLLRIGSKGISKSHVNSLGELLQQHEVVKVKVNTPRLGSLEDVFEALQKLVEASGRSFGVELLQTRKVENTILFGREGITEKIRIGEFPPVIKPWVRKEEE